MPGVYLSYPFCAQKCTYCNFASGVFPRELERDYQAALLEELERQAWPWTPETIYWGGGTPGAASEPFLAAAMARIPGREWREATMEAAPGGLTGERLESWRAAGINRVSLGVQSFVQPEIARTGRKHTAETVAREAALLREHGLENFNIDLIAGLAGQTGTSWRDSLDWIERLAPPHVSVYMLEVDEDSRLGGELLRGGVRYGARDVPPEERIAEFYEYAVGRLAACGLRRYEISNFARPGWESAHNLKYWRLEPYLGFGADAHSFSGGLRWQNVESAAEYVARWRAGQSVRSAAAAARPDEEKFFVGLRLMDGVRLESGDLARFGEPLRRFLDAGLLERQGETIRLTQRGVLLSNEVFEEFVSA